MTIQQLYVNLGNTPGQLAGVTEILKNSEINIRAITIAENNTKGVLRMIVNNPDIAENALKEAGFVAGQNQMVAIEIDDREGLFYDIVKQCDAENINIEYTYSFVETALKKAILFLRFKDTDKAVRLFVQKGYKLLSNEEVCRI
ncbi:MAG: amino acid-binding protein [Chitinispirillia bacterium]|nr:amino acid-binding protein [Chitinispirillia bacterium]